LILLNVARFLTTAALLTGTALGTNWWVTLYCAGVVTVTVLVVKFIIEPRIPR